MKYDWSSYFQNSLNLESTRLMTLNEDMKDILNKWLPMENSQTILDVGCGNGAFTAFLKRCIGSAEITGVDLDTSFIEEAKKRNMSGEKNKCRFIQADGLMLPFEDDTFDLVISHTYLTSVPEPEKALKEKIRVTKKEGFVASITGQSVDYQLVSLGNYPKSHLSIIGQLYEFREKANRMYKCLIPQEQFVQKHSAEIIPQLFGMSGLRNISMHPVGIAFSLSDCRIPYNTKKRFIRCFYDGEILKLKKYMKLAASEKYMTAKEAEGYICTIKKHQEFLLDALGENMIWEWYGGSNMLMLGQKSQYL